MLSMNADSGTFANEHKSGAELWRSLVFNYGEKFAYTVEIIEIVERSKSMTDILPKKFATRERLHIEFANSMKTTTLTSRVLLAG